jgi:uncharacterized protein (TIGR00297 family)
MQFLIGLTLGISIAFLAYRARSLSRSGAMAAALVGTIVFGIGGWQWAVLLLTFFISSSALTRAFGRRKRGLDEKYAKGSERDAAQVFSNGGIPAIFAVLHFFFPNDLWPWIGFAGALAAVNADTWATELGILNPSPPRLITDLRKRVEKGTSGGVSLVGTLASLAGSALIALLAALLFPLSSSVLCFTAITLAGLAASLFDSLLGATVQAMYFCPKDQKETEKHPLHSCGTPTVRVRGWEWLTNDRVNVLCSMFGAGLILLATLA